MAEGDLELDRVGTDRSLVPPLAGAPPFRLLVVLAEQANLVPPGFDLAGYPQTPGADSLLPTEH